MHSVCLFTTNIGTNLYLLLPNVTGPKRAIPQLLLKEKYFIALIAPGINYQIPLQLQLPRGLLRHAA